MKTWTNPSVEELEIEKTALWHITSDSEYPNGKFDGNIVLGGGGSGSGGSSDNGQGGTEDGGNNEGGNNEGSDEGGFGTES